MTDERSNTQDSQAKNSQAPTTHSQTPKIVAKNPTVQNPASKIESKVVNNPEPQMKKVDIVIAGVTYSVYCPIHEEEELRSAVYYINNFALDIKRDAPNLGQENLLVLSCLNLYEKINGHKKTHEDRLQGDKQSAALLSKIINDAQSIL